MFRSWKELHFVVTLHRHGMGFCGLFWFAFHCFSMLFFVSDGASDQPLQEGGKFFLFDASKNTKRHEIFFDGNVHFKDLKIVRPYHRTWFSRHGTLKQFFFSLANVLCLVHVSCIALVEARSVLQTLAAGPLRARRMRQRRSWWGLPLLRTHVCHAYHDVVAMLQSPR